MRLGGSTPRTAKPGWNPTRAANRQRPTLWNRICLRSAVRNIVTTLGARHKHWRRSRLLRFCGQVGQRRTGGIYRTGASPRNVERFGLARGRCAPLDPQRLAPLPGRRMAGAAPRPVAAPLQRSGHRGAPIHGGGKPAARELRASARDLLGIEGGAPRQPRCHTRGTPWLVHRIGLNGSPLRGWDRPPVLDSRQPDSSPSRP